MGTLTYGEAQKFTFEDRLLSHIKIAIVTKLLRHESFLLNWTVPPEQGSGRVSVWISRESQLTFRFDGSRPVPINQDWIEALALTSARTGGMQVMRENEIAQVRSSHARVARLGEPELTR